MTATPAGARTHAHAPHPRRGRLLFLAHGDVRKGRSEPIFYMRMADAFAGHGLDVTLYSPTMRRPDQIPLGEIWSRFGVPPRFALRMVPTPLESRSSSRWQTLGTRVFLSGAGAALSAREIVQRSGTRAIVYSKSPAFLAPFAALSRALPRGTRLVLETHALPGTGAARVVRGADLIVVNSEALRRDVGAAFGLPAERLLHAPLGPHSPVREHPKERARATLGLPLEAPIACYSGRFTEDQNEVLMRAAGAVRDRLEGFRLLLVGGHPDVLPWTRRRARELGVEDVLVLTGEVAPQEVDLYQSAADLLVMYMSPALAHFAYATPAKAYEYMAVRRPIVANPIPLFDEVFGGDGVRALKATGHGAGDLADAILRGFALPEAGGGMVEAAAGWVGARTWEARTERILAALR